MGEGYSVEIATKKNAGDGYDTAVVVTKNNESNTLGVASEVGHPRRSAQPMPKSEAKIGDNSNIITELDKVSKVLSEKAHEWIKWIQDDKTIRIDQKEKVLNLINSLRTNPVESERIGLNLDHVTKIVKDFVNPTIPEGIESAVNEMAGGLNTKVRIIRDVNEITDYKRRIGRTPDSQWKQSIPSLY